MPECGICEKFQSDSFREWAAHVTEQLDQKP